MKQETVNGTIIIPYWKSAPYWPLIYTNIAGVCTFEKFVVDSKIMSCAKIFTVCIFTPRL
jgi:hypothetical protein